MSERIFSLFRYSNAIFDQFFDLYSNIVPISLHNSWNTHSCFKFQSFNLDSFHFHIIQEHENPLINDMKKISVTCRNKQKPVATISRLSSLHEFVNVAFVVLFSFNFRELSKLHRSQEIVSSMRAQSIQLRQETAVTAADYLRVCSLYQKYKKNKNKKSTKEVIVCASQNDDMLENPPK